MFFETALAQSATTTGSQPNFLEQMVPLLVIFGVFYFLLIRPQAKQKKEQQKMIESLKRGDQVYTSSGILGKIEELTEKSITLEIDKGVKMKVLRGHVGGLVKENN
jgi:preprotein translocase subunit YajC